MPLIVAREAAVLAGIPVQKLFSLYHASQLPEPVINLSYGPLWEKHANGEKNSSEKKWNSRKG